MKKETLIIQSPTSAQDEEAITKNKWVDVGTVKGVMLPYGSDRALKEYGYTGNVKYRFFLKGTNHILVKGNLVLFKGQELIIVYVADYGKAMDVLMNTTGTT